MITAPFATFPLGEPMKTLHLVAPRTGPNNAGDKNCMKCGAVIFASNSGAPDGEGGESHVLYDETITDHTTDPEMYNLADGSEEIGFIRCT